MRDLFALESEAWWIARASESDWFSSSTSKSKEPKKGARVQSPSIARDCFALDSRAWLIAPVNKRELILKLGKRKQREGVSIWIACITSEMNCRLGSTLQLVTSTRKRAAAFCFDSQEQGKRDWFLDSIPSVCDKQPRACANDSLFWFARKSGCVWVRFPGVTRGWFGGWIRKLFSRANERELIIELGERKVCGFNPPGISERGTQSLIEMSQSVHNRQWLNCNQHRVYAVEIKSLSKLSQSSHNQQAFAICTQSLSCCNLHTNVDQAATICKQSSSIRNQHTIVDQTIAIFTQSASCCRNTIVDQAFAISTQSLIKLSQSHTTIKLSQSLDNCWSSCHNLRVIDNN